MCKNCSSVSSKTIKETFKMRRNLKDPLSALKILLNRGTYDMTGGWAFKNECIFLCHLSFNQNTIK